MSDLGHGLPFTRRQNHIHRQDGLSTTQTLRRVQHTIDVGGVATSVRSAVWTVYDDAHQTVRTATRYATGSAPSYSFTLINPVEIREFDKSGKPTAVIRAVRASTAGKLQPTDTFAQSSYVRWMTYQYTDCCLLASQRVYHTIPASGPGSSGTNCDQTSLGYDVMKRRNRTQSPGGTISFSVADVRNLPIGQYVGTDDIGATWTDPTGGGAPGNNMVQVSASEYDNGFAGRDGNLTLATACVDASTTRVTSQTYDWRNRLLTVSAPESVFTESTYDNFDRVVTQQSRDTNSSGTVLSRVETFFDDRGRVYQTKSYGLNATTPLTSNAWFDAAALRLPREYRMCGLASCVPSFDNHNAAHVAPACRARLRGVSL